MSRIAPTFARIREAGRGGLVTYLTAGDPDVARSEALLLAAADGGADLIEVGVPFSDPLADGPVIQRGVERALAAGMTLRGSIELVRRIRARIDTPIVLFTYLNPVLALGLDPFVRDAADAGVDGVLVLDAPVEESSALRQAIVGAGLDPIFLLSPTTTDDRIRRTAELGRGFLYLISRLGVTGMRDGLPAEAAALAGRVRAVTDLPLAVGFGIARPEDVAAACRTVDAAVVGSALVNAVAEHAGRGDLAERIREYVRWLKSGL